MANRPEPQDSTTGPDPNSLPVALPAGWLSRWPWATFLLPMIVYMLVGQLEPKPPSSSSDAEMAELATESPSPSQASAESDGATSESIEASPSGDRPAEEYVEEYYEEEEPWQLVAYQNYPYLYTLKIALTMLAMILVWPG